MDLLIKLVPTIYNRRNEENQIDRLNFQYTSYAYVFFAGLIMSKQYMGTAITCWTPAEFRKGWIEYTTDYCLIENTYWVPIEDPSLPPNVQREEKELPYYQWVQFVLVFLAFCFMIPHYFWRTLNWRSGVQVRSIVQTCVEKQASEEDRDKVTQNVANHINSSFAALSRRHDSGVQKRLGGQTITIYYIIMKILFLVNILAQLIVLHIFLGFNPFHGYYLHGWNSDWKSSGLFPRTTMCDFEVRTKGNVQRYSVQCVLSLNMFNEKIFALLFLWLVILLTITFADTVNWILFLYSDSRRKQFAQHLLKHSEITEGKPAVPKKLFPAPKEKDGEKQEFQAPSADIVINEYRKFVNFTPDQALVYKLLATNAGPGMASIVSGRAFALKVQEASK